MTVRVVRWVAVVSMLFLSVDGQNTAAGGFPCRSRAGCGSLYPDNTTPQPPPPQLRPVDPACPTCPFQTQSDQGTFPNTPSPAPNPRYYAPTVTPTPGPTDVGDYTAPLVDRNPPATPLPSGATPRPPIAVICVNVCPFARNGQCEDGGPGTTTSRCRYGEDCADCGGRQLGGTVDQNGNVVGAPLVTSVPTPRPFFTPNPTIRTPVPLVTQASVNVPLPTTITPRPFFTTRPTPVPTAANWERWRQFTNTPFPPTVPNTLPPPANAAVPQATDAAGNAIARTSRPTTAPPFNPVVPTVARPSPEPTTGVPVADTNNKSNDSNKLALIIALAIIAAVVIIGIVAFVCVKKSKSNKKKKETDNQLKQISSTGSSFGSPYDTTAPGYNSPPYGSPYNSPPQFTYGDVLEMPATNPGPRF